MSYTYITYAVDQARGWRWKGGGDKVNGTMSCFLHSQIIEGMASALALLIKSVIIYKTWFILQLKQGHSDKIV